MASTGCIVGGILGIAFVIPLRKQMIDFNRLPFPGGIAVAAILKSPGAGIRKAKLMLGAAGLSAWRGAAAIARRIGPVYNACLAHGRKRMNFKSIAVEGPIGVGKTSLVERLAEQSMDPSLVVAAALGAWRHADWAPRACSSRAVTASADIRSASDKPRSATAASASRHPR